MQMTPYQLPEIVTFETMRRRTNGVVRWLWEGYIAFGSTTLLTSRWKTGKTTLISALLSRLHEGGTLAGSTVTAAPATVATEEAQDMWVARGERTPFGPNVQFVCRPFIGRPTFKGWLTLLELLRRPLGGNPGLVVIDPLGMHLPGNDENNAKDLTMSLAALRGLTERGSAVLLLHHPRKGRGIEPRGSGALTSIVDVLMELDGDGVGSGADRRRWLRARGRHAGIPCERLIELNEAGTDYRVCDPVAEDLADGWSAIQWVLVDANSKMTREQILENWPENRERPHRSTICTWLEDARRNNLIHRDGLGRRNNPFRYWLPDREKQMCKELPPVESLGPVE